MAISVQLPERRASTTPTIISSPTTTQVPSATQGLARANALQSRIATVLSASYADSEISEALKTLDARGILNTAETRRNLRLDLQQESIACNGQIVKDFSIVAAQLRRVGTALEGLNKTCAAIRTHVTAAKRETGPMLEEHASLVSQKRQTESKQRLLSAFNTHFVLSDAEITALTSTASPVDAAFYSALSRTRQIHNDCQVLLGSEDQTLGLELLEQSSTNLNAAFQKLFRWTQRELKTIDLENPQLSSAIRHAFRVLAERPALFQECIDFFAESRERTLSDSFYAALTGGAQTKAIELSAHEPLRYVGDMLAWLHAATVGEKEALANLFVADGEEISQSFRRGQEAQPWLEMEGAFDGKTALMQLVDRDLEGVCRQLRQRVEQTIRSHEDAVLAYQIANLTSFYAGIFEGLLGSDSSVKATLGPLASLAMEQFRFITRDTITSLADADAVPEDLSPPDFLADALATLKQLIKSYETSSPAAPAEREEAFSHVLREAFDPYLQGCETLGGRLPSPDRMVFKLNCLAAAREALVGPAYGAKRLAVVDESITREKEALVIDVAAWLREESGLAGLLDAVRSLDSADMDKARALPELGVDALADTARVLDDWLPSSSEDARTYVGRLRDRVLVRDVVDQAAEEFVGEYEGLEKLLEKLSEETLAKAGDDEEVLLLRDVFPRTSAEIRVLIS